MDFPVVSFSQSLIETLATAWLTDSTVFFFTVAPGEGITATAAKEDFSSGEIAGR
jgi:hypothetical protein